MRLPLLLALAAALPLTACVRRVVDVDRRELERMGEVPPKKVDVNIVSDDQRVWDVVVGGNTVCSTPCAWRLDSDGDLELRRRKESVYLHDLGLEAIQARRAVVVAEGTRRGEQVNGIVWTTFGGMGLVVGITLTAVGCSDFDRRGGMCTAGLITGGISAALMTAAILMLVDSVPRLHVLPVPRE